MPDLFCKVYWWVFWFKTFIVTCIILVFVCVMKSYRCLKVGFHSFSSLSCLYPFISISVKLYSHRKMYLPIFFSSFLKTSLVISQEQTRPQDQISAAGSSPIPRYVQKSVPSDATFWNLWASNARSKPLDLFGRLKTVVVKFQGLTPCGSQDIHKTISAIDLLCSILDLSMSSNVFLFFFLFLRA